MKLCFRLPYPVLLFLYLLICWHQQIITIHNLIVYYFYLLSFLLIYSASLVYYGQQYALFCRAIPHIVEHSMLQCCKLVHTVKTKFNKTETITSKVSKIIILKSYKRYYIYGVNGKMSCTAWKGKVSKAYIQHSHKCRLQHLHLQSRAKYSQDYDLQHSKRKMQGLYRTMRPCYLLLLVVTIIMSLISAGNAMPTPTTPPIHSAEGEQFFTMSARRIRTAERVRKHRSKGRKTQKKNSLKQSA